MCMTHYHECIDANNSATVGHSNGIISNFVANPYKIIEFICAKNLSADWLTSEPSAAAT